MTDTTAAEPAPKTGADYAKDCRDALGKNNNCADMEPLLEDMKMSGDEELAAKLQACVTSSNAAEAYKLLDEAYPPEPPPAPAPTP